MNKLRAFSKFRSKCNESLNFLHETLSNDKYQSKITSISDANASTVQIINCIENETLHPCMNDSGNTLTSNEQLEICGAYVMDDAIEQTVTSYFISDTDRCIESTNFTVIDSTMSSHHSNVSVNVNQLENASLAVAEPIDKMKRKTVCPDCGAYVINFGKHLETHKSNGDRKKPYTCEWCQRAYINRPSYIGHINKHKNIRPFACNKCDKTFHGAANLRMHMNSHETIRKFQCNECSKTFRYCHDLATHRRIHAQNPIYECEHCNYKNVKLQYLKRHALIHNNVYRFTCNRCMKGFNRKEYYRNHVQNKRCKQDDEVLPS